MGSSPRVWGQVLSFYHYSFTSTDHPHACGDKKLYHKLVKPRSGSSPRVWGQELIFLMCRLTQGIIPTRVGTRLKIPYIYSARQDHPHACGDKTLTLVVTIKVLGSSPRVWGQDSVLYDGCNHIGIIPTRVGTRGKFGECW